MNTQPLLRDIAHRQFSTIRFDAAATDGEPKPEAGALGVQLLEGPKQLFSFPGWQSAALVLDFDKNPTSRRMGDFRRLEPVFESGRAFASVVGALGLVEYTRKMPALKRAADSLVNSKT